MSDLCGAVLSSCHNRAIWDDGRCGRHRDYPGPESTTKRIVLDRAGLRVELVLEGVSLFDLDAEDTAFVVGLRDMIRAADTPPVRGEPT